MPRLGLHVKIFLREHWKRSWDFQGELLGEPYNRLPRICGVMSGSDKSLGYEAVKESVGALKIKACMPGC